MDRSNLRRPPRETVKVAGLVLFLTLTLRVFQYFPGVENVDSVWLAICGVYLFGPYLLGKVQSRLTFSLFELYVLLLMLIVPIVTSVIAWNVFGQPIYYGIGALRGFLLCAGALFVMNGHNQGNMTVGHMEKAFLFLAWFTLVLFTAMTLFLDPSSMSVGQGVWVKGLRVGTAQFNFSSVFIVFAFFYYIVKGYKTRNMNYYLLSLPFFSYIFFLDRGRARLVAMLLSALILIMVYGSFGRNVIFTLRAIVATISIASSFYIVNSVYVLAYLKKLSEAFVVLFLGSSVADISANQRIFEARTALPYIADHWVLGCGRLSILWEGGFTRVMGRYFFPGDIGMLGVLFLYGTMGSLLFAVQFLFARQFSAKIPDSYEYRVFATAISGYLLFFAIHSIVAGLFALYVEVGLLMTAVLYCARRDAMRRGAGGTAG